MKLENQYSGILAVLIALCLALPVTAASEIQSGRQGRSTAILASAIRHELLTLPRYNVFDWIEAEIDANGRVTLEGTVVEPLTRQRAESRTASVEGVTGVTNDIEVLPPSPTDDRLRLALYQAIFNWDSPLLRYAQLAVPPIHIIVDMGRVTLMGNVQTNLDRQYAYAAAVDVMGVISVTNDLTISGDSD